MSERLHAFPGGLEIRRVGRRFEVGGTLWDEDVVERVLTALCAGRVVVAGRDILRSPQVEVVDVEGPPVEEDSR